MAVAPRVGTCALCTSLLYQIERMGCRLDSRDIFAAASPLLKDESIAEP
jgi:hypothetical protein